MEQVGIEYSVGYMREKRKVGIEYSEGYMREKGKILCMCETESGANLYCRHGVIKAMFLNRRN